MEYVEPLNNVPVSGGYAGRDEINKMRDLMSLLGNPADTLDSGLAQGKNMPPQPRRIQSPQKPSQPFQQYNQNYIPGMNEVPLNESTNYDYNYYNEPQYIPEPSYNYTQPQMQTEDISFIKNDDARNAVEKYLNRGMSLYSEKIQEIICLDESIESLKKDAKEIKSRYVKSKELKMDEASKIFSSQYKEAGTKIKIFEIRLKNTNNSINEF